MTLPRDPYQPPPGYQLVPIQPPTAEAPTYGARGIPRQRQQHPTNLPVSLPRPTRRRGPLLAGGVLGGIAVLGLLVVALTGGGSSSNTASQSGYTSLPESSRSPLSVPTVSRAPVAAAAPVTTAPPTVSRAPVAAAAPAPARLPAAAQQAAPAGTVAQRNAVDKAESYLSFAAFSRTGLIKQLEFEGFDKADATYGVDHVTVDWTEQADKKAQSYMDYSSFSRSGLIKQLQFEGFTAEQAAHGAAAVGL